MYIKKMSLKFLLPLMLSFKETIRKNLKNNNINKNDKIDSQIRED